MRAGWMRPSWSSFSSVRPRDLAPHAVEARQDDRVRRVVDDEVDAGEVLQRADVAALAADDAALHVVGSSWTTDTVVSAAWPAARRCMQTERMLRTRRSASRLVSSSIWRTRRAESCRAWSSTSCSRTCGPAPASGRRRPLELADVVALALLELLTLAVELAVAVVERVLPTSEIGELDVDRLLLGDDPLLDAHDLGAALEQLGLEVVARGGAAPIADAGGRPARWAPGVRAAQRRSGPPPPAPPRSRLPLPFPLPRSPASAEPGRFVRYVVERRTGPVRAGDHGLLAAARPPASDGGGKRVLVGVRAPGWRGTCRDRPARDRRSSVVMA